MRSPRTVLALGLLLASGAHAADRIAAASASSSPWSAHAPTGALATLPVPRLPMATSPLDATLATPPLSGELKVLEPETMNRTHVVWDVPLPTEVLRDGPEPLPGLLQRALEADPRFRVTEVDGATVAYLRQRGPAGWEVSRHGYHHDDGTAWRADIRFSSWARDAEWAEAPHVARVGADDAVARLDAWGTPQSGFDGFRASGLSVQAPGIAWDVYELGPTTGRPHTIDALDELSLAVDRVRASWDVLAEDGPDDWVLPSGEPGRPLAPRIRTAGKGLLDVRMRIDPGAPGWTWVRLVTPDGTWAEEAVGAGTRERLGWSDEGDHGYWMQGQFATPSGPGFEAVAEVWFQPDDGEPRRLGSWDVVVPAR